MGLGTSSKGCFRRDAGRSWKLAGPDSGASCMDPYVRHILEEMAAVDSALNIIGI